MLLKLSQRTQPTHSLTCVAAAAITQDTTTHTQPHTIAHMHTTNLHGSCCCYCCDCHCRLQHEREMLVWGRVAPVV